jgi:hypothetical protein
MFDLPLVRDRHSFKSFVRVRADAPPLVGRGKLIRRNIIQQQEWAQILAKTIVVENRSDRETVANPMGPRTFINVK